MQGLHLLLTYKCNARCGHCFISAGPDEHGVFSSELAQKVVAQAASSDSIDHLFLEGGEPFLYPDLMRSIIAQATESGLWVGALTNGFWAVSKSRAHEVLSPMVNAGLRSLSISTDAWHEEFVPVSRVKIAAEAAAALGIDAGVMACAGRPGDISYQDGLVLLESAVSPAPVYSGGIVCRGRAASEVCVNGSKEWESLDVCRENLAAPSRVHVGPGGEIHLCQGLLLGPTLETEPLLRAVEGYEPTKHPIVKYLCKGGPAALADFALSHGWRPGPGYVDACHLCFEVRAYLSERWPRYLGPANIYGARLRPSILGCIPDKTA